MNGLDASEDASDVAESLLRTGMSAPEAVRKAELLRRCTAALRRMGAQGEPWRFFVPGRVEVLGKHTDYAGGRSLLMAAERGLCAVAAGRPDGILRLVNADDGRLAEFEVSTDLQPSPGHWSNYPMTVARRLARNFAGPLRGADVAFASDLPPAAGMSSSSAMVVLTFLLLDAANGLRERDPYRRAIASPEALAEYLGCVENGQSYGPLAGDRGVGTFGGSEDHTAILCCRPGCLSQYSFCPVRLERTIPFPAGHVMVIGVSGVMAEKTGEAQARYNRLAQLTRHVRAQRPAASPLAGAMDVPYSPEEMRARREQLTEESDCIIPQAGDALSRGDLNVFGRSVDRSQALAEKALGNQVPQTIFLARSARELGACAASAFGAGFGGSVWAMVSLENAPAFIHRWNARYAEAFPKDSERASFFLTSPGPAAIHPELSAPPLRFFPG